ncbi:hypothetical protein BO71DRAFT_244515 [Aspergillus ellipticus CBS 707.79]|uniref:Uncharacterized protein n=1 Tax=Aspergillus ellipticus CBS 707.79 TaxID=1448320 RepID=A0A319E0A7_9EURO|nr:hypothetical protein BO71DRAFT_244515 [Aspergillus ellipticus CBS 707.79]
MDGDDPTVGRPASQSGNSGGDPAAAAAPFLQRTASGSVQGRLRSPAVRSTEVVRK